MPSGHRLLPVTLVALLALAPPCLSRTWHILPDGTGDAPTIQAGVDSAAAGDTVEVACGTYCEHDILVQSDLVLRSNSSDPSCVTIDAQQASRVITCDGTSCAATIEGLTLSNGYAGLSPGGGIYCQNSASATVRLCTITHNSGLDGGGLACRHASTVIIEDCLIAWNQTANDFEGGGISCYQSHLIVARCTLLENEATIGGGMICGSSSPTIVDCVFINNCPGAIYCWPNSYPNVSRCTFYGNAGADGSAFHCYDASPIIVNSILAFGMGGPAICCRGNSAPTLSCCDVFGHLGGDWVGCIASQQGINGNFSADPMFCGAGAGDLTLDGNSPCMPANNSCGQLIGAKGYGCGDPTAASEGLKKSNWARVKHRYR